jgi:cystathionine beta-lyase
LTGVRSATSARGCDLTALGTAYTPFASVSDARARVSITCVSASKAFNLAGLQARAVKGLNRDEVTESKPA